MLKLKKFQNLKKKTKNNLEQDSIEHKDVISYRDNVMKATPITNVRANENE